MSSLSRLLLAGVIAVVAVVSTYERADAHSMA
jgi:hypothetical protein